MLQQTPLECVHRQAQILDDLWIAHLEYSSDITRIWLTFWLNLAKQQATRIIYGDVDVPMIFGD